MAQNPSPRHAVVTGGARNIGLGIACRLREDGWRVFVLDIEAPEDPALRADAQRVDLTDIAATTAALQHILAQVRRNGLVPPLARLALLRRDLAARARRYNCGRHVLRSPRLVRPQCPSNRHRVAFTTLQLVEL